MDLAENDVIKKRYTAAKEMMKMVMFQQELRHDKFPKLGKLMDVERSVVLLHDFHI